MWSFYELISTQEEERSIFFSSTAFLSKTNSFQGLHGNAGNIDNGGNSQSVHVTDNGVMRYSHVLLD